MIVRMAVCPKCSTNLYQEREKVPSLENASTMPMLKMQTQCREVDNFSFIFLFRKNMTVQRLNVFNYELCWQMFNWLEMNRTR